MRGLARLHTFHVELWNMATIPWGGDKRSLLTFEEHAILDGLVEAGMNLNLDIRFRHNLNNFAPHHLVKVPRI